MPRISSMVRNLFRKQRVESELDAEVRSFVEMKAEENVQSGMSRAEARRAALLECGGVEQVKESVREVRAGALIEQCWQDIRFGLRMLRKNPGFATVAILTIALGIGLNASIFTIFNSLTLRPLNLNRSDRLVDVYQTIQGDYNRAVLGGFNLLSHPDYETYRDHNEVFSGVAAYKPELRVNFNRQEINGQLATCNYFEVVQVKPVIGRTFTPDECSKTGDTVVLSHSFWQNSFQADPNILGKVLRMNGTALTVIGVAPPEFQGTMLVPAQFWAPISMAPALVKTGIDENLLSGENISWLAVIGRLKDGATIEQARANLSVLSARIDQRTPNRRSTLSVNTSTLVGRPDMHKRILQVGVVVLIAVGLVLLIACANIANLMLARATGRTREVAVRLAVGASRGRLVRQLLTESLLIAFLGGTVGLVLSAWSEPFLVQQLLARVPQGAVWLPTNQWPDLRILGYALSLTLLTGIAFGLAPALQGTKPDVNHALKNDNNPGLDRRGRGWMRGALLATQVAGCMVLLVAAGLLLRGLYHAQNVDPGYNMDHVGVVSYKLVPAGYTDERAANFNRDLEARLRGLSGIQDVIPVASAPLAGVRYGGSFNKPGDSQRHAMEFNNIGAHFFSALGIPLVRGRAFTDAESSTGAPVVIVNESAARLLWPGEDPIGKQLKTRVTPDVDFYEVVGVSKDVQLTQLGDTTSPYVFMTAGPHDQLRRTAMLVQTQDDFARIKEDVRSVARALDNDLSIDVAPLKDNIEQWVGPARICVLLSAALGGLGLILAAVGIYGSVAYSVARRAREIGIRMALGARRTDVMRVVVRQAMRPVVIGAAIGVALCAAVSKVLAVLLFGLSPFDAIAYGSVVAFLLGVALLASYIPARRALRIDPMSAIRHE